MMNRRNTVKFLVVAILSGLPLALSANGFRLADQDAFATARGEAFVATADNPSAIYYNPAGITQLEGNNLRSGIYGIYLDPSFNPPGSAVNTGNTYHSSDNLAAVPQLFYTYTLEHLPLSFGLGVYAPYGGSIELAGRHRFPHGCHEWQADLFDDQSRRGSEAVARSVFWRWCDGKLCEHGFGTRYSPLRTTSC